MINITVTYKYSVEKDIARHILHNLNELRAKRYAKMIGCQVVGAGALAPRPRSTADIIADDMYSNQGFH